MLTGSRLLMVIARILLLRDAVLMASATPNPAFNWPLPCPITLTAPGLGLIFFVSGSRAFK